MRIKGSCLCGDVRFELQGDAWRFFICHCTHCQKDTGSAFAANVFFQHSQLQWLSGEAQVVNFRLPHSRHVKSFCRHCGSALPRALGDGACLVPSGCVDDQLRVAPAAHIFTASQACWETQLRDIPAFAGLPE